MKRSKEKEEGTPVLCDTQVKAHERRYSVMLSSRNMDS